ncbi:MAG TPA: hypothetical protein VJ922_05425 [Actinomycetota bacterium]|nr:hypothetical protein [Actinomycetota bacterium]
MKAEGRLVWGALRAGALLLVPGSAVAFAVRGTEGALAVVAALAIVVGNFAISGLALMIGSRRSPVGGLSVVALPSYAIRMVLVFVAMGAAYTSPRIHEMTFTIAFTAGVVGILIYECLLWARTPWLAIEFGKERS